MNEFSCVSRTLVPMYADIHIDEVEKRGQRKILEIDSKVNVAIFPGPYYTLKGSD